MFALFAGLVGCSDNDELGGGSRTSLKPERLDLSGATALTLVGTNAKSRADAETNTLFKMDANGNLTAVVLYVQEEADGSKTTTRTDISVHPGSIHSLSGKYTYLRDCLFTDENGNGVYMPKPDNSFYYNILVQNSTGKIYYVPESAHDYFPQNDTDEDGSAVDNAGNLYLRWQGHVAKATFTADQATISSYGPQDLSWSGEMHVLSNGTLFFLEEKMGWSTSNQSLSFLYPNGGYEHLDGSNNDYHSGFGPLKDEYTYNYNGTEIMALKFPLTNFESEYREYYDGYRCDWFYKSEDVSISIVKVNVGTVYGGIGYSAPIATITGKNDVRQAYDREPSGDWTDEVRNTGGLPFYETNNYYLVSNILAYNKRSGQWRDLKKEGISEHFLLPESDNVYNGKIWNVYSDCADWFNIETFEYGRVMWPDFSSYTEISFVRDIPHGKVIKTMISPMDGKKYIFTINIETGAYQTSEVSTQAEIISLIPLN